MVSFRIINRTGLSQLAPLSEFQRRRTAKLSSTQEFKKFKNKKSTISCSRKQRPASLPNILLTNCSMEYGTRMASSTILWKPTSKVRLLISYGVLTVYHNLCVTAKLWEIEAEIRIYVADIMIEILTASTCLTTIAVNLITKRAPSVANRA